MPPNTAGDAPRLPSQTVRYAYSIYLPGDGGLSLSGCLVV